VESPSPTGPGSGLPASVFARSWSGRRQADIYETGRPDYPPAGVGALTARLGLRPRARVLDVGAGTGKLTRALLATGAHVLGAEPADGMRQVLTSIGGVDVVGARAEHLPFATSSLDAVTVAQAIHWFDVRAATAEFHRVLRPGGHLAVVTNHRDERVPWVARISAVVRRYEALLHRPAEIERWVERLEAVPLFGEWEVVGFPHEQRLASAAEFDARFTSMSAAINMPADLRRQMVAELRSVVPTLDGLVIPQWTEIRIGRRK
jgi:SAM-dependent methyltransferase